MLLYFWFFSVLGATSLVVDQRYASISGERELTFSFVTLSTNDPTHTNPVVLIKADSLPGDVKLTPQALTYTDGGWSGIIFHGTWAVPKEVSPSSTISWSASVDGEVFSPEARLVVPVARGTYNTTIGLIADMGQESANEKYGGKGASNATIKALNDAVDDGTLSMIVHAGDISYADGTQPGWDIYMRQIQNFASRVPYQVCVGNHEHYFNFSAYRHRFHMPNYAASQNLWHSFDFGGIHFLAASSEHDFSEDSMQYKFLQDDLESVDESVTPWIVLFLHKPIYCSTDDYYDCEINGPKKMRPVFEPLLQKFKVDLVIAGHLHGYERSFPVLNGTTVSQSYDNPGAPVHVVVGNAGDDEGLTDKWLPSPGWSAEHFAELGYSTIRAESAHKLVFNSILSETGDVKDSFVLTK